MSQSIAEWLMHGCIGVVGLWLCVIDLREHRLPNRLTGSLCGALVTLALINPGVGSLTGGVVASVFTAGFFALLALVPGRGLGWGDVKFQAGLGFYLGFVHPGWEIVQVMTAFFLGSLQGLGMVFSRRGSVRDPIAFGPWMMAGVCLSIIWAQSPEII